MTNKPQSIETDIRKDRKLNILATWLAHGNKVLGTQDPSNVYTLVHSLLVDMRQNAEIYFNCDWNLDDAYQIAELADLEPIDKCAVAVFMALKTPIRSHGYRRCCYCRKEKPPEAFSSTDKYCRKCRAIYNRVDKQWRHHRG